MSTYFSSGSNSPELILLCLTLNSTEDPKPEPWREAFALSIFWLRERSNSGCQNYCMNKSPQEKLLEAWEKFAARYLSQGSLRQNGIGGWSGEATESHSGETAESQGRETLCPSHFQPRAALLTWEGFNVLINRPEGTLGILWRVPNLITIFGTQVQGRMIFHLVMPLLSRLKL